MSFRREYGLFLLKTVTVIAAATALLAVATVIGSRVIRSHRRRGLQVRNLNRTYEDLAFELRAHTMPAKAAKAHAKALKKERKALDAKPSESVGPVPSGAGEGEGSAAGARPRVFVVDFRADVRATEVAALREEITAIVTVARHGDEVVVRLENSGGLIADHGLAAAQLMRVRARGLRLIVAVDKVAASGGYLMACVGDRILAAPFAVVGSIGVIAQIPNMYRLLDRTGIEVEQVTGGEFKRTVTPFTRTTAANREKLTAQIQDTHALFKDFVTEHRPQVDVERVGTGEYWYGTRAVELGLVDELVTSDDYLLARSAKADLFAVNWSQGHAPLRRLAALAQSMTSMRLDHTR